MPRDGTITRTTIMDSAQSLILGQGFSATSVDKVIEQAGITKGAFFHHFKTKADLALALVERYANLDQAHLDMNLVRAEELARDPLQQMLIFIGLLKEEMAGLTEPFPGCLYASFCYEAQLFDDNTHTVIQNMMLEWRRRLSSKFVDIIDLYPPKLDIAPESLADMALVIYEGAFILSKTLKEPVTTAEQLGHYRNYVELLFETPAE
ncbi:MAG: TetR/AcrR family transcriptional regulator [Rhodospirillaceae bacterium]|jgi:TetR/AcrR family transcriptional regulator, transcriptional repressor for nem operon|nr:TetR/AcrR family transcriptional regulator [Rhodospirillaceae bacterium]MBT4588513.1 TetR/AcrR family transcriptional regulator [Rhodospirillaceae bacterium]MBT4939246.1 TetR/AcrR family transcriptional regulator [Rhodospirillaceae bacterium]MBT5939360.1 TetR/AcrR family transcriptional regulator [Rhodospirillaceae bacterium]MBT7266403.1 TetR/AcrR family transcriptional regulator [Rhodospirillaceae bacterium]